MPPSVPHCVILCFWLLWPAYWAGAFAQDPAEEHLRNGISQLYSPPLQGRWIAMRPRLAAYEYTQMLGPSAYEDQYSFGTDDFGGADLGSADAYQHAITYFSHAVALNPQLGEAYQYRGYAWLSRGQLDSAAQDLNRALQLDSTLALAHFHRGNVYAAAGDYAHAARHYAMAIRHDSALWAAPLEFAYAQDQLHDLQPGDDHGPQLAETYVLRGQAHQQHGDDAGAWANYTHALAHQPCNGAAHRGRGQVYRLWQMPDSALAAFSAAIMCNPADADAYYGRAQTQLYLFETHNAQGGRDITRAIQLDSTQVRYYRLRAQYRKAVEDFPGAIADLSEAIERDSFQWADHNMRAELNTAVKNYLAAISDLSTTLRLLPNDEEANRPTLHFRRGNMHCLAGDTAAALADFNIAIEYHPCVQYYVARALLHRQMADTVRALQDLASAIHLDGPVGLAYFMRGRIRVAQGEWVMAEADFSEAICAGHKTTEVYLARGANRLAMGRQADACADFHKAREWAHPNQHSRLDELISQQCP